jgi:SAM-dependent methyltransferase
MAASGPAERWSHNRRYYQVILDAIPPGCGRALDVGCGAGGLTRRLRAAAPRVTGLDRDEGCVRAARAHPAAADIGYLVGDVRNAPLRPESFDLVASIAVVHHLDAEVALRRMSDLLRPGGVLAVVGLARDRSPADLGRLVPAIVGTRAHAVGDAWSRRRTGGRRPEPYQPPIVWPPPLSYRQMRRLAVRLLPGVRYRRHLYWRYSLVWTKPR